SSDLEKYQFLVCNFANADMVGHTGNIPATIEGIRLIDECLEKIKQALDKKNGCFIITADHGNAEEMLNPSTGEMDTEHSRNPVPFIIISDQPKIANAKLRLSGVLADIAPTILDVYNIPKPEEMTGKSLIVS
ncbi:2,3-bisphosphoglycerate-independent phosphoglycerate mutase, partial [Patescibacteria group bacterium]